jgi:hypothetical protein
MNMNHECERYGSFEDWFLNEMDGDEVRTLRDYGASCGVGGLIYNSDIWALFSRFGSEIEELAREATGESLGELCAHRSIDSVNELVTLLVWATAEHLAMKLEGEFDTEEDNEEECDDEADDEVEDRGGGDVDDDEPSDPSKPIPTSGIDAGTGC